METPLTVSQLTVSERLAWSLTLSQEAPWGYGFLDFQHVGHWQRLRVDKSGCCAPLQPESQELSFCATSALVWAIS